MLDLNLMTAGEAGQGIQSMGFILSKLAARSGLEVFADQDYESRIRGGHNFFRIRVCDREVRAISERIDLLVALNQESIDLHGDELKDGGVIIYDSDLIDVVQAQDNLLPMPLQTLAKEKTGNKLMSNTIALGAAIQLVGLDLPTFQDVLKERFGAGKTGEANAIAAGAGFDYARARFRREVPQRISSARDGGKMLLSGTEATALGAVAAGCRFIAAYPMTPTTGILEYITEKAAELDIAALQAEDEIAAVMMAIGASYAGLRAMTATSGGGFSLMVESVGLSGMTETPLVIVEGQRPGPATGLPTRTEQGDLKFVIHAAQGEFPRGVFAPSTINDCFWLMIRAFNMAEKYQVPVIVLTDHNLANSYGTVSRFDLSRVKIDRGWLLTPEEARQNGYKRHLLTPSGISPRAFPGRPGYLVFTDGDEHDEDGHICEDAQNRINMMDKRLRKLPSMVREMGAPVRVGPDKAELTLVSWGSTFGAVEEAVRDLSHQGASINAFHFTDIWPFPADRAEEALAGAQRIYAVENNATGQFASLMRAETGIKADGKILKYDGRPITPKYIMDRVGTEVLK